MHWNNCKDVKEDHFQEIVLKSIISIHVKYFSRFSQSIVCCVCFSSLSPLIWLHWCSRLRFVLNFTVTTMIWNPYMHIAHTARCVLCLMFIALRACYITNNVYISNANISENRYKWVFVCVHLRERESEVDIESITGMKWRRTQYAWYDTMAKILVSYPTRCNHAPKTSSNGVSFFLSFFLHFYIATSSLVKCLCVCVCIWKRRKRKEDDWSS